MNDCVRILVVDGEPYLRRITARLLREAGYEVIEAATGSDGLRSAREEKPDLILLDVVLPDIDGLEVCRRIKADARLATSHVILVSGLRTTSDDQANGLEAGADGYITRPVSNRELLARAEAALRLKRAEDAVQERTRQLAERVRELNCLYGISQLREQPDLSLDEILKRTADLIPPACQHPDLACARIILEDREFKTANFEETTRRLAAEIQTWGTPIGKVELGYREFELDADEGPFLPEEGKLLHAIAERLGRIIEWMQMETALRVAEERYRAVSELTSDLAYAFRVEPDGNLVLEWVTEAFSHLTGHDSDELAARGGWRSVVHPEDLSATQQHVEILLTGQQHGYELRIVTRQGQVRWLHDYGRPVWDEAQGRVVRIYGAARDITESKLAEEAQRQSERELSIRNQINSIFLTHPDEAMYAEILQLILSIMRSEFGTFGYFDEEGSFVAPALTRKVYWEKCNVPEKEIIFRRGTFGGIWSRAIEERKTLIANEGPFCVPQGHITIENTMVTPVIFRGEVISAIHLANKQGGYDGSDRAMVEMIAAKIAPVLYARLQGDRQDRERKRAEEALRQSEQRYRSLFEQTIIGIVSSGPDGRISGVNPAVVEILGYSHENELVGQPAKTIWFAPAERSRALEVARELGHLPAQEIRLKKKDDSLVYTLATATVDRDDDGGSLGMTVTFTDITELRATELALRQSESRYQMLLEALQEGIWVIDHEARTTFVNPRMAEMLGYTVKGMLGKHLFSFMDEQGVEIARRNLERRQMGIRERHDFEFLRQDGSRMYASLETSPMYDEHGSYAGAIAGIQDITERVEAEWRLKAALAEKEILLKEIHHRVKNNLQLISAMLDLQARTTGDKRVIKAFEESQHRILSMARIHEQLYGSQDLSQVDMAAYIQDLADDLQHSYGRPTITIHAQTAQVSLDVDQAIPCGLIINELVSNALKHAFPGDREQAGEIQITLRRLPETDGEVELAVSDNGIGLPDDLEPEQGGTLGLTMVSLLARQLRGSLVLDRNNGTTFRVTFRS